MKCNLPYLCGKDHPGSKHGKIERCLRLMQKSGRKTFTAIDIENATNIWYITVTKILIFTDGVEMNSKRDHHKKSSWRFTGDVVNIPAYIGKYKGKNKICNGDQFPLGES